MNFQTCSEGASTRTSVFVLRKGEPTRYPVPYTLWQKTERGRGLDYDSTLEEVLAQTRRLPLAAAPVDPDDPTSAWLTARPRALSAVRKVLGRSEYEAHAGVTTWANSVYWLEKVAERPDGLWVVRNITEGAKREAEPVTVEIEPDLLYPLVRGRDVRRWLARPSAYLLMTQDPQRRRGLDPKLLQSRYPKTWAYLKRFEGVLRQRSGFQRYFTRRQGREVVETGPFYSIFNVGEYTFAPWKVVWPNMGDRIEAAVVSEYAGKPVVPQHIVTIVPFQRPEEAYFVAALVNSTPFQFAAYSYSHAGSKGFGTPQILEHICLPTFDPQDPIHAELAALSEEAHRLAPAAWEGDEGAQERLRTVEAEIDERAARLWGLTPAELKALRASLEELKGEENVNAG